MCAGAIFHSRLSRVLFAALDPKTGAAGSATDAFSLSAINHHCKVEGGLMAEESAELLQDFFRQRRSATER
jgi:tRNA(adenine34) deaminase